ncbi:flap endonuclease GEN homolog 1-like [Lingula anatina]|uniref:Flap endonuclease GEN homolog 1-like n=1 Tax=Lingula anatina TaxID=7574 RepID=A0A1S3HDI9_LINAN|nr:flap endonuclease GEN homolog 1-like [Lingula anatina]|eukprot:XP_013384085.1 flap endonuclease GEN homolog 1-like [Lingula anatina]
MGVKGLWPVLEDVKQVVTLRSLRGQTVAIDLSGWIVQSHGLKDYKGTHQHLRNLFFKVKRFLIDGINAVFVLDGSEPARLKYETVRNRRSVQSGHVADTDQCDQQKGYLGASSHCGEEREGMDERIVRSKRFEQIVEQVCINGG